MSLPPGFLDELRNRTSLSQIVGRKVAWDMRKTNQAKGDWWAPCPFHQEKTASFHVDDRKGFYYCFGCQAKGDLISFVRETENVDFIEAVEILAREAGMEMPARDPQAQAKADRRGQLTEVMDQAVRFFGLQLRSGAGGAARDYLIRRGLRAEVQEQFELGFAPDGWQGLWDHLTGKGVPADLILACGLARESTKGGKPYDVFRGRIMFPIRDARGRCIAFGGRAMDPNDNAKYLNSPETELFDKSRTLYNHGPAREAAGKGQPLIVAEGYMDVIALVAAGFTAAVAPLGTAVTETQLQLLWRLADEPVIALDGDRAGLQAAERLLDLALPLIGAGRSLRFALLPEGQDPDDLIRASGPGAMRALIDGAEPLVALLWRRETEAAALDSPERRAALDGRLRTALGRIADPSLRAHYTAEIRRLRGELFAPPGRGAGGARNVPRLPRGPLASAKRSELAAMRDDAATERLREAVILAILAAHPPLIAEFTAQVEMMDCADPAHRTVQAALLALPVESTPPDAPPALPPEAAQALEKLRSSRHVQITPALRPGTGLAGARRAVAAEIDRLQASRGRHRELEEAVEDFETLLPDEGLTWRLGEAARTAERAARAGHDDKADDREDREARERWQRVYQEAERTLRSKG